MYDVFVSVVVPLRDAASSVEAIIDEIEKQLAALFRNYEIVLMDDASSDNTAGVIRELQKRVRNLQLYCLNRRGGLDVAIVAGLDHAIGDFVITMNPQADPVSLIPALWEKSLAGNEIVCGVRSDAGGNSMRARLNRAFFKAYAASTGYKIPPSSSDLRLLSRRVVGYMIQNNDRHLLLKVLPFFTTQKVGVVEYQVLKRPGGFPPRTTLELFFSASSILLASSARPLRLMTLLALGASTASLVFALYVVGVALFKNRVVEGWVSIALPMALMFFLISVILGLLSEYIYMLAQQAGNRPVYSIGSESTSNVLDMRGQLNVFDGRGENSAK